MMNGRMGLMALGAILVIAVAVATVSVNGHRPGAAAAGKAVEPSKGTPPSSSLGQGTAVKTPGWTPPEGDPVMRYRELRNATAQARKDLISNFMALGHERNPYMLIEALSDADPEVRLAGVENASALPTGEAIAVLAAAAASPDGNVREMAWSLSAPYPPEGRASIYSGAIRNGNDTSLTEVLNEMGVQPGKTLFEMMLGEAMRKEVNPQRQTRLLTELQTWLVPGGGNVPRFNTVPELVSWWQAQTVNYDEYLLRTDPDAGGAPGSAPR
jgi:hypothetical protein